MLIQNPTTVGSANEIGQIRDRVAAKLPANTFHANKGAHFPTQTGNAGFAEGLDMSDDVRALLDGEGLSEEFAAKATTKIGRAHV